MNPKQLLDLIIAKAPELRACGIRHVNLEGFASFEIADADVAPAVAANDNTLTIQPAVHADALDDPDTYGSERAPGFDLSDLTHQHD